MAGLKVLKVDLNVQGIKFVEEKIKKETQKEIKNKLQKE